MRDIKYTACYTQTEKRIHGQLLEWPEVISEGATIEECRDMLRDALTEMSIVYKEDGLPIPEPRVLFEQLKPANVG